jgi:hypothetical protein
MQLKMKKFNLKSEWVKKFGIGAFLFFLIKGIGWLILGWFAWRGF